MDTMSADLEDADPANPATALGIRRWDLLRMGTSTAEGATEVGRRFLEASKRLSYAGQATITGYVFDDHGIVHPYYDIRAGDSIRFVDAHDPSPRRVVRADKDEGAKTCTVDLDAPPDGLAALLERLDVVLVPLGVTS
jgi:hypothetical protein